MKTELTEEEAEQILTKLDVLDGKIDENRGAAPSGGQRWRFR